MKKTIYLTLCLCLALIVTACAPPAQYVHLRKSPTPALLGAIRGDRATNVSYSFRSDLPDAFDFKGIIIDLNKSYASNMKHYMENKYTVSAAGAGKHKIDIVLVSCKIETAEAGTESANFGAMSATIERLTVTTTLTTNVRVETDGQVTEEEIVTVGEYTGNIQNLSTGQFSISMALEGNILLIDRFLNKTFHGPARESEPVGGIRHSDI